MIHRRALHDLVDAIPEHALSAAEAFLAFLRDREESGNSMGGRGRQAGWAADERRGLEKRRRERDADDEA